MDLCLTWGRDNLIDSRPGVLAPLTYRFPLPSSGSACGLFRRSLAASSGVRITGKSKVTGTLGLRGRPGREEVRGFLLRNDGLLSVGDEMVSASSGRRGRTENAFAQHNSTEDAL